MASSPGNPFMRPQTKRRTSAIRQSMSALESLMNMGFPKHRVEKALAATGHQDLQIASDWLLNHMDDPTLDQDIPREYVLYACAVGPLGADLDEFWNNSLAKCGWNGAHSLLPHITLCSFFHCPDSKVQLLCQALQITADRNQMPDNLDLELFSSQNFIGLFVKEGHTEFLKKLTVDFADEAAAMAGCKVEPHKKELHLTLAYQFNSGVFKELDRLSRLIKVDAPARWEMRLYSRDPRVAKAEVLRVLYPHVPRADDELELITDDYVFTNSSALTVDSDGWFRGMSHSTGCNGMFPGNYTEKAPESDTWTVHRVLPLTKALSHSNEKEILILDNKIPSPQIMSGSDESQSGKFRSPAGVLQHNSENHNYENLYRLKKDSEMANAKPIAGVAPSASPLIQPSAPSRPRKILIVRHAERIDVTFGEQWLQYCFDQKGIFHRRNLNMPKKVPPRAGGKMDFKKDSPITSIGEYQARLTGEAIADSGIHITQVYSSPALRCVQTADAILKGFRAPDSVKIRVDPSLFEWLAWCKGIMPKWLPVPELSAFNLNVDTSYTEKMKQSNLELKENSNSYYKRTESFMKYILEKYPDNGDILIVGHASSLDGISRPLQGLSPRPTNEFCKLVQSIPYCGCVTLSEYKDFGIWDLSPPPFATLTHAPNSRFDWRTLQS